MTSGRERRTQLHGVAVAVFCSFSLTVVPASGESKITSGLKHCAAIEAGLGRLLCYDKLAKESGLAPGEAAADPSVEKVGQWQSRTEASKLDGKAFAIAATKSVSARDGSAANFVVRCLDGKTNVYWVVPFYISAKTVRVRLKIGDGNVQQQTLSTTEGGGGFGVWRADRSVGFAKSLYGASSMVIEVKRERHIPAQYEFDVSEARKALSPIANACSWD